MAKSKTAASKSNAAARKKAAAKKTSAATPSKAKKKTAAKKPKTTSTAKAKAKAPKAPRATTKGKAAAQKPTAAKPTAPKKTRTKPPSALPDASVDLDAPWEPSDATPAGDAPRGLALVEKAIATLDTADVSPLSADMIAALTLPNGKPLPPSLARVLAFDALQFVDENDQLKFLSFGELMRQEFDEQTATVYVDFEKLLPGRCLLLEGGSDSRRFMYVGEPDSLGEYPVFVVDTDDVPYVCIAYPGLDLYFADGNVLTICEGTYEDCATDKRYKAALEDQAKRNFHGLLSVELGANVAAVPGVDPDEVLMTLWGDG